MTDQSDLQQALVPLAKAAGEHVMWAVSAITDESYWVVQGPQMPLLPGANGSLEGEVEVVLGWLIDAGDDPLIEIEGCKGHYGVTIDLTPHEDRKTYVFAVKPTLHEALAEAVKALPREDAE